MTYTKLNKEFAIIIFAPKNILIYNPYKREDGKIVSKNIIDYSIKQGFLSLIEETENTITVDVVKRREF